MESWTTHQFEEQAYQIHDYETVHSLKKYAQNLKNNNLPVIFTLPHFAKITNVNLGYLIKTINRTNEDANYRMFAVAKRSGGRRFIHAPTKKMLSIQSFINKYILSCINIHSRAFAYNKNGGIVQCATQHLGAKWLFQFDLCDFFYSICECDIYKIFKEIGYTSLLSFELARLCTTIRLPETKMKYIKTNFSYDKLFDDYTNFQYVKFIYNNRQIGVLPQGSPSSPMLSNLVAYNLDESLNNYALENGMVYTRYADDISISAVTLPRNKSISGIRRDIIRIIRKHNFKENRKKFRVAGPGARKTILGLLVDGDRVRISKDMFKRVNRKLYAINKFGIESVAKFDGFDSAFGLYNHIQGLLAYIKDADIQKWKYLYPFFKDIKATWKIEL